MKRLVLLSLIAFPVVPVAQKQCVKGKPCGHTCIAVAKTCHVERPAYAPSTATAPASADSASGTPGDELSWVGSSRGEVYYRRGCGNADRLTPENRVFRTEEEAKRAGYRRSSSPGC